MESLMTMRGMALPASLRTHELEAKAVEVQIAATVAITDKRLWAVVDADEYRRVLFTHTQPHVVGAYIQGLYDQAEKRK